MDGEIKLSYIGLPLTVPPEIEQLPELVKNGLQVICLCRHGKSRSCHLAKELNNSKIKATFIDGGIHYIQELPEEERKKMLDLLSSVPNLVITLDKFEQKQYENEIELIKSKRLRGTNTIISQTNFIDVILPQVVI